MMYSRFFCWLFPVYIVVGEGSGVCGGEVAFEAALGVGGEVYGGAVAVHEESSFVDEP